MKLNKYLAFLAFFGLLALAACSDNDDGSDYPVGPEVKAGNQQVHFTGTNKARYMLSYNDASDRTITLEVARNNGNNSLTVPLKVLSADLGLVFPENVTFNSGETTTKFNVNITKEVELGENLSFEIELQGDETDPYAKLGGGVRLSSIVSFPNLYKAECWISGFTDYVKYLGAYWTMDLIGLDDNYYMVEDFMHSGKGIYIRINSDNTLNIAPVNDDDVEYSTNDYGTFTKWRVDGEWTLFYPWGEDAPNNAHSVCFEALETNCGPSYTGKSGKYYWFFLSTVWLNTYNTDNWAYWWYYQFRILEDGEEPNNPIYPTILPSDM